MKTFFSGAMLVIIATSLMSLSWRADFDKALSDAKSQHKLVLLKFSGSDWCLPCIRMERSLFKTAAFDSFATSKLIMVNADFPRQDKHKPDRQIQQQNEALAARFDKAGHFPYTVLLDSDGKVLKAWDGYTGEAPADFIHEIAQYTGN